MKEVVFLRPTHRKRSLSQDDLSKMDPGSKVYLSTWIIGGANGVLFSDAPALVAGVEGDDFVFIYIGEDGCARQGRLPIAEHGVSWNAEIDYGLSVKTPDGEIWAHQDGETTAVTMYYFGGPGKRNVMLGWTGYREVLPVLDFVLNPDEVRREIKEVPLERLKTDGGLSVSSRDDIKLENAANYVITPGLVTYIYNDNVLSCRVFHAKGDIQT